MFVQLHDPNLSGPIEFEYEYSPQDLQHDLRSWTGFWVHLPGADGRVLLSEPEAWVFLVKPADVDPYPDFIVTEHEVNFA